MDGQPGDGTAALVFAGYEVEPRLGRRRPHGPPRRRAIFPDALRWLWKDFPARVPAGVGSKQPVMEIVGTDAAEGWQLVGEGYQFTEGPAANAAGELFFTDVKATASTASARTARSSVFVADSGGANGMMFGPDGRLYAAQSARKRVVAYDAAGRETVLADGIDGNDLAVSRAGFVWVTEHPTTSGSGSSARAATSAWSTPASRSPTGSCCRPIRACSTSPTPAGASSTRSRCCPTAGSRTASPGATCTSPTIAPTAAPTA